MDEPRVTSLILLPSDLASDRIGGIQSFVKGFIKFAPADFRIECVGASVDRSARPIGRWRTLTVEGRDVRYLPIVGIREANRRERVPLALRYTLRLAALRSRIHTQGRILQFHRAGTPLPFAGVPARKIEVVHLDVRDIYGQRGESRWRLLPGAYDRIEHLTLPAMDRIFVVNRDGLAFYRRRHPAAASRLRFLPTWFDETIFRPAQEPQRQGLRRRVRIELGLADGTQLRIVLWVGRLEEQKDPRLLIDAFSELAATDLLAHLVVVGDGELRRETERRAAESGYGHRIHLLGVRSRPDVARLMNAADLLLLPSRFEGMPITALEALACGLPVVATPVGELTRLLPGTGAGWLAPERTPASLADGLRWALRSHREALASAAVAAAAPYAATRILQGFYDEHYLLADEDRRRGRSRPQTSTDLYGA